MGFEKYERDNFDLVLNSCKLITFLTVFKLYDGNIIKIEAETYRKEELNNQPVDRIRIICKDTKRRKEETLKKCGVTKEEVLNGCANYMTKITEYFEKNKGLILLDNAKDEKINVFNTVAMAKKCDERYKPTGNIDEMKSLFISCLKRYERLEIVEMNKFECTVDYAYYWASQYRQSIKWVFCVTSIGRIYYDTLTKQWNMTRKEKEKTGLIIEHFDIKDVEAQLIKKYKVDCMDTLVEILRRKAEDNCF